MHSREKQEDGNRAQRKQGGWNPETFDNSIDSKDNLVKSNHKAKFLFQRHFRDSKGNLVKSVYFMNILNRLYIILVELIVLMC